MRSKAVGWPVVVVGDDLKESLHMAKMASGGGSQCCLTPFLENAAQVFDSSMVTRKVLTALLHVCDEEVGGGREGGVVVGPV